MSRWLYLPFSYQICSVPPLPAQRPPRQVALVRFDQWEALAGDCRAGGRQRKGHLFPLSGLSGTTASVAPAVT